MADGNSEDFKFNLDSKDALNQVMGLKDAITSLGDSKNLAGLVSGFTSLAGPIAIAGTALFAIKEALDLTKQGEEVLRVEKNFELLANQAGLVGDELKVGIEKGTHGMVDLNDAMKSANKALVELGPNAAKIPEIFDLATKTTKIFGGTVTENFEQISSAIANGNTRLLRHLGLKVDATQAERQYAVSIGKTVDTLTQYEKQQAVLNAVLDKGSTQFKNISGDSDSVTGSLTKLGVQFKEFGQSIAVIVEQNIGPYFKTMIDLAGKAMHAINQFIKPATGTDKLEKDLAAVNARLKEINDNGLAANLPGEVDLLNKKKQALEDQLKVQKEQKALAESGKGSGNVHEMTPQEAAKAKAQVDAFNKDLIKIREQRLTAEMAIETDAAKFSDDLKQKQLLTEEQYDAQIEQIKSKAALGGTYTQAQANQIIVDLEAEKQAKIQDLQNKQADEQLKVYANQVAQAKTAASGMAAAFSQGSAQAARDSQKFGEQGVKTFNSVKTNAVAAFKAMGDGSKSAGEAIRGFLLNSIADYVEMKGEALLLEGLWPPNPIAIAAGGGLIALSAAMRNLAGSAGASSSGGGGGGTGGGVGASSVSAAAAKPEPTAQQQKSVTIQVSGHYIESDQSNQRLLQLIRDNTDATDFKYQQIGVGS